MSNNMFEGNKYKNQAPGVPYDKASRNYSHLNSNIGTITDRNIMYLNRIVKQDVTSKYEVPVSRYQAAAASINELARLNDNISKEKDVAYKSRLIADKANEEKYLENILCHLPQALANEIWNNKDKYTLGSLNLNKILERLEKAEKEASKEVNNSNERKEERLKKQIRKALDDINNAYNNGADAKDVCDAIRKLSSLEFTDQKFQHIYEREYFSYIMGMPNLMALNEVIENSKNNQAPKQQQRNNTNNNGGSKVEHKSKFYSFGTLVTEIFGKPLSRLIRGIKSSYYKNRLNSLKVTPDMSEEAAEIIKQEREYYEDKLANKDIVDGYKLFKARNVLSSIKPKLYKGTPLTEEEQNDYEVATSKLTDALRKGLSKKLKDESISDSKKRATTILDQYTELLSNGIITEDLIAEVNSALYVARPALTKAEYLGYLELFKHILSYRKENNITYEYYKYISEDEVEYEVDDVIKYYDSEEYEKTNESYYKRRK